MLEYSSYSSVLIGVCKSDLYSGINSDSYSGMSSDSYSGMNLTYSLEWTLTYTLEWTLARSFSHVPMSSEWCLTNRTANFLYLHFIYLFWDLWVGIFQAEDGIRDFCLSRGLGDVYKRQSLASGFSRSKILCMHKNCERGSLGQLTPVSYTHLTLPTILLV